MQFLLQAMRVGVVVVATVSIASGVHGQPAQGGAGGAVVAAAPSHGRVELAVPRSGNGIKVDAVLDEPEWQTAPIIPVPFEIRPGNNTPARVETRCRVFHSDQQLFFGCDAIDPDPGSIRANLVDRDQIGGQDAIGIIIDPFNQSQRAFWFGVNALGVQIDGTYDQQRAMFDNSWDAIWKSAGRITATGYVVEAAIPFKSLRFPRLAGTQRWGFYAYRDWPRSDFVTNRSIFSDPANSCLLCQTQILAGFAGVAPGRNVELTPTFTGGRTDVRSTALGSSWESGDLKHDVGLDTRWSVTPDVVLNATINPDFSQVEADVAQLDVNNRFTLSFPEKRPFFLEGADLFATPINAVFTRTIVDPTVGAKLTGRTGPVTAGTLVARDEVNQLLFPANQGSSSATLNHGVTAALGRVQVVANSAATIGALVTVREGDAYHNRVAGVDVALRPLRPVRLRLQYLHTDTEYPDSLALAMAQPMGDIAGNGYRGELNVASRNWALEASYDALSSGFRADAGFVGQVDQRELQVTARRMFWGRPGSWFSRLRLSAATWPLTDYAGRLTERWRFVTLDYQGPLQSSLTLFPRWRTELFQGVRYDFFAPYYSLGMHPTGWFHLFIDGVVGKEIDYFNARLSKTASINPWIVLRTGRHVELELRHAFKRLSYGDQPVLTANLSQLRLAYFANPRAFARVIVQYRRTTRNQSANLSPVEPVSSGLLTQWLLSYKVNPQTVVFLGYGDTWSGGVDAFAVREPFTRNQRTLFFKLGYALRP